jgi:uncharacterized protein YfaS (alpha-2-macroglobulin family)
MGLQVAVKGPAVSGPGSEVAYRVSVRDGAGRPVSSAHISGWAVDEGLLALADHEIPDLAEACAFRPAEATVAIDSFAELVEPFLEAELVELGTVGLGYGRGADGLGGRRARRLQRPGCRIDASLLVACRFTNFTTQYMGQVQLR